MKHLKLFEDHNNNDQFYMNMVMNAIRNHSTDTARFAIQKANEDGINLITFDNKKKILYECMTYANYNILEYIDDKMYKQAIEGTKELDLLSSQVKGLENISCLENLEGLKLNGARFKTFKGIENCKELYFIEVMGEGEIESLKELSGLTKMEFLYLGDNKIKSLDGVQNMHMLGRLLIDNNQIEDLSPLENCDSLRKLDIGYNNINTSDLSYLKNCISLLRLDIEGNNVDSLEPLRDITSLRALNVRHNQITTLKGIENLDLNAINCEWNKKLDPREIELYVKHMGNEFYYETDSNLMSQQMTEELHILFMSKLKEYFNY